MAAAMRGMSVASSPKPMMFTLPKPSDGFKWVQLPAGPALVCRFVDDQAPHLFTTRPWRLGTPAGAPDERTGWDQVAAAIHTGPERLLRLRQVHGCAAVTHRPGVPAPADGVRPEADIVISDDPSVALAVQTADCVPILMVDGTHGVVAAVHAGWRGLAARAPVVAVERMAAEFGTRAEDLRVAIGPAIGACCYEVGPEVRTAFERASFVPREINRWFSAEPVASEYNPPMASLRNVGRYGHWFFDAAVSARDQLHDAGLRGDRIFVSGLCTASHPDVFCSYRRDGAPAGRMSAAIRLARP
jgi:YfiH family protein